MCWSLLLHLSFHVVSSCCVLPCDPSDVACVGLYCSIFRSMWSVHAVLYHVIHLMFHVLVFMFHLSFHVFSSCGVLPCDPSDVACVGLYCSIFRSMWSVHVVFYHVIHLMLHVLLFMFHLSFHVVLYHVIHLLFHVLVFMFHLSFHVVSSCCVLPCDPSDVACVFLYVPSFVPCGQFMLCSTM